MAFALLEAGENGNEPEGRLVRGLAIAAQKEGFEQGTRDLGMTVDLLGVQPGWRVRMRGASGGEPEFLIGVTAPARAQASPLPFRSELRGAKFIVHCIGGEYVVHLEMPDGRRSSFEFALAEPIVFLLFPKFLEHIREAGGPRPAASPRPASPAAAPPLTEQIGNPADVIRWMIATYGGSIRLRSAEVQLEQMKILLLGEGEEIGPGGLRGYVERLNAPDIKIVEDGAVFLYDPQRLQDGREFREHPEVEAFGREIARRTGAPYLDSMQFREFFSAIASSDRAIIEALDLPMTEAEAEFVARGIAHNFKQLAAKAPAAPRDYLFAIAYAEYLQNDAPDANISSLTEGWLHHAWIISKVEPRPLSLRR